MYKDVIIQYTLNIAATTSLCSLGSNQEFQEATDKIQNTLYEGMQKKKKRLSTTHFKKF